MDQYHQVQLQAQQAQIIAESLQLALSKAAEDIQLKGYGLGMLNLKVLKLAGNQLTGGLPPSHASFR